MTAPVRAYPDRWVVSKLDPFHPEFRIYSVQVVLDPRREGWVITDYVSVLDRLGNPIVGRVPPECVYPSATAALEFADPIAEKRTIRGRSVADVIRENAGGQP